MNARRLVAVLVTVGLGLGISGCTGGGASTPEPSTTPPALTTAPPSVSSTSSGPVLGTSTLTPAPSAPATAGLTIYGVAHESEQRGCFLLTGTDNRVYLLLGGDRTLITEGRQLAVTGRVLPAVQNSQCREGIPFEVSSVRAD